MAVTTPDSIRAAGSVLPVREADDAVDRSTPRVVFWAVLGAAITAFIIYAMVKWVTGPYFKTVQQGPTQLPGWMHYELLAWQVFSIPAALGLLYWFVVRPWRRDRHVGTDGILLIGFSLMWFQDPLSSAIQNWVTYNDGMLNFGSWTRSIPFMSSYATPGHMISEPILFTEPAYVYMMFIAALFGCLVMRLVRRRWPGINTIALVGICYLSMCVFDFVLEGCVWLPLGIFEYPGGHWNIFPSSYHPYPLNEMFTVCIVFTGVACLRFFTDDKGHTWMERGIDRVKGGAGRKLLLRGLASIAAVQVLMFLGYNVPNTYLAASGSAWPKAVQERSYLTDYICGSGTDRLCSGPDLDNMRNGAPFINAAGKVVVPRGDTLAKQVPFIK